ncbi:BRO-like gene [Invertebrate iridescent virus 22]|uniref:BRO-like protein n=1 Tax=Invertebrate iridescent virus 22 TaxID=345198 RepID=S6DF70_9VIRU|nr:BRO-like gene [Invertebrate iridescent virus 22]CCV01790.1 BRO-like gene [Invertebrate iridescent virus 22]
MELIDIFSFIKEYNLTFDVNSGWFQDLWYPLSKSQPPLQGGLKKVEKQPKMMPIIVTSNLLEWMGYQGKNLSTKQEKFCKLLRSLEILYDEIGYNHPLAIEYPCVQREAQLIPPNNLNRKKWICMDVKAFKKVVMRLNTKNAEIVRDYYLNLEEAMFAYGEYTMNYVVNQSNINLNLAMEQLAIKDKSENELQNQLEEARKKAKEAEEAKIKAERKAVRINKFMRRVSIKEKKLEWIYIATTNVYSSERIFKIGSTTRLSNRIGGYNTGRPIEDSYYYSWVKKCYNSNGVDYHIQKLLSDFKHRDNAELYCGIKFTDLRDIVDFIVDNYDASIDYINNFIKTRLNESLEEDDEPPPRLDCKKITYQIGEHTETIDVQEEDLSVIREELENILSVVREQRISIVERKELMNRLLKVTNTTKKDLWYQIKELTGWKDSKTEIDDGGFKYKIIY